MLQTQRSGSAEGLPRITQACTNSVTTAHLMETLTEKFSHWQCWRRSSLIGNTGGEVLPLTILAERFSYWLHWHWQRSSPIVNTGREVLPLTLQVDKFSHWQSWRRSSLIGNTGGEVLPLTMLTEKFSYWLHWQRSSPIVDTGREVLLLALQPNEVHGNVCITWPRLVRAANVLYKVSQ